MESIESRYAKAFCEVKLVIDSLTEELYYKIPKSFINMITDNMDKDYSITIEELKTKGLMKETNAVVSLIYRDFLCSDEIRELLIKEDELQLKKEMDSYNQIFEKQNINEENINPNLELTVIKELKWYQKLFNKIRNIFVK